MTALAQVKLAGGLVARHRAAVVALPVDVLIAVLLTVILSCALLPERMSWGV